MAKPSAKPDRRREARLEDEILVDSFTPDEHAMSWYYYLEGKLRFPFKATCTKLRAISPFQTGESLSVTGLAPVEDCQHEIIVMTEWHGRALGVPLAQLTPGKADADTKEGVEDWHYWVARGYQY